MAALFASVLVMLQFSAHRYGSYPGGCWSISFYFALVFPVQSLSCDVAFGSPQNVSNPTPFSFLDGVCDG